MIIHNKFEFNKSAINIPGSDMFILNDAIEKNIQDRIIDPVLKKDYDAAIHQIPQSIDELYSNIPDNKRSSYGIVHTIKVLSKYLYDSLVERNAPVMKIAGVLFTDGNEFKSRGVALGILSFCGLTNHGKVLTYFETAAGSPDWNLREFTQMFFRKLIGKHPDEMHDYLLRLVHSNDSNIRRFVSETLRPVCENQWFYKDPNYSLSILSNLYKESSRYPRTSVGNNLSDLARRLPDLVYGQVAELVQCSDKNSYWIAYRACRNLVKTNPIKVMDLLKVDEYTYKNRRYRRDDSS